MEENDFKRVVEHIFNNWTALKLAVEHGMGGPDSKTVALDFLNYMTSFCLYEQNVDVTSIQEALEDILDEEFSTECEDNSTNEIANILFKFSLIVKTGSRPEYDTEFSKLPVSNSDWLVRSQGLPQAPQIPIPASSSVPIEENISEPSASGDVPMEQDEWTEVKPRRRK